MKNKEFTNNKKTNLPIKKIFNFFYWVL